MYCSGVSSADIEKIKADCIYTAFVLKTTIKTASFFVYTNNSRVIYGPELNL